MKLQRTLTYIISVFWCLGALAQENTTPEEETNDSVTEYKQRYGLRVGADLSRLIQSFADDNYSGLEIVADYRLNYRWYAAAELGYEEKITEEDYYTFTTTGNYIKLGGDYNSYDNWFGMENIISLGFRYGFSTFSQDVSEYTPFPGNPYWNETASGTTEAILQEHSGLSAHWLEFVLGMKVELVHNVFLGGSVRLNYMITDKAADNFPNLWVPGFNKITDGSSIGMGYNYSLTYLIPLYKKSKSSNKENNTKEEAPTELN